MNRSEQVIYASWLDTKDIHARAVAQGWTDGESYMDVVEVEGSRNDKRFPSVTKAKAWAIRNRDLDLWRSPEVIVYEKDEDRQLHRVRFLRYVGDGLGWEELDA